MIAKSPADLLTSLHQFLGVRSGPRYFNRHLEERINPAGSGEGGVPEAAREMLTRLLDREIAEYFDLLNLLRPDLSAAVRNRHGIGPVATPSRPVLGSDQTG